MKGAVRNKTIKREMAKQFVPQCNIYNPVANGAKKL
jgi:hypothetical protein